MLSFYGFNDTLSVCMSLFQDRTLEKAHASIKLACKRSEEGT